MYQHLPKAMSRVPATLKTGVKKFFCGPESFTPDLAPAFGETPEIQNYFVAAGMNSIGILTGRFCRGFFFISTLLNYHHFGMKFQ